MNNKLKQELERKEQASMSCAALYDYCKRNLELIAELKRMVCEYQTRLAQLRQSEQVVRAPLDTRLVEQKQAEFDALYADRKTMQAKLKALRMQARQVEYEQFLVDAAARKKKDMLTTQLADVRNALTVVERLIAEEGEKYVV